MVLIAITGFLSYYWCWIANDHFTTKIVTHYFWYWSAGLFSLLTALAYLLSALYDTRLPAGFLWIGFPIRGNRLIRIGLFSVNRRIPNCSWSTDIRFSTRTITFMLPVPIQYFNQNDAEDLELDDEHKAFAFRLIWFPIAFIAMITPQSVKRFLEFNGKGTSQNFDFAAAIILALPGVVDVALFYFAQLAFGIDFNGDS